MHQKCDIRNRISLSQRNGKIRRLFVKSNAFYPNDGESTKYVDDLGKVDGVDDSCATMVYAKTRIINQEIVHYLSEEAFKRIDCRLNDSAITKPLHHWKTTILLHDAVAPAMTASALKPEVHPEDSGTDWIKF